MNSIELSNVILEELEYFNTICGKYSIDNQTIENIRNELITGCVSNMERVEFLKFIAKTALSHMSHEPLFTNISANIQSKIYDLIIGRDYKKMITSQYQCGSVSEKFYNFIMENADVLESFIVWERDCVIDYFGLMTLENAYLLKNADRQFIERPQMLWLRVAIQVHGLFDTGTGTSTCTSTSTSTIDEKLRLIKETYDYTSQLYFTHATPTLYNSGANYPQLSSCYLLQCPDDLELQGDSFKQIMLISKWAGGIGINLSDIRSNNSLIKSNGGRTNSIVPLCKVLESLGRYVNQSSKRKGSIACFMEPWHADINDFLDLNKNTGDVNLRARDLFFGLWVPDLFMKQLSSDGDWYLMNPVISTGLTDCWGESFENLYWKYVSEGKYVRKMKAKDLYLKIIELQFETGTPYMMFKDTINARSNQQNVGVIKNSNLCSEIVEYSSNDEIAVCNLGSISLTMMVDEKTRVFNFEELGKVVRILVRNLNNIIDINYYPVKETRKSNMRHRPIGVGVQGLANCYYKMGFGFDSVEATELNKDIFECIYWNALSESNELAKKYGPYETFEGSPFSKGLLQFHLAGVSLEHMSKRLNLDWASLIESIKTYGTYNCLLTTIMPTASTSQILNNNESIEPYASNLYKRKVLSGEFVVVNKYLIDDLKKLGLWNDLMLAELKFDGGSVQKLDIPVELKNKYKISYELKQSVIVKQAVERGIFIDQSQSMNLFIDVNQSGALNPQDKLASAHMYAWKNGLKTGSYYVRSKPVSEAIPFSIDIDLINQIKAKRGVDVEKYLKTLSVGVSKVSEPEPEREICTTCSA